MAARSRTTFKKRQKELARQDKQREKVARRMQRKLEKQTHGPDDESLDVPGPDSDVPAADSSEKWDAL